MEMAGDVGKVCSLSVHYPKKKKKRKEKKPFMDYANGKKVLYRAQETSQVVGTTTATFHTDTKSNCAWHSSHRSNASLP